MTSHPFRITTHIFQGQHIRHYPNHTRPKHEHTRQYLEAKIYVPLNNNTLPTTSPDPNAITLLATTAISFPKEMYEPLFADLLTHTTTHHPHLRIASIWSVDKSDHGASGVLNEATQSDDPSWLDHARDLLALTNAFRDEFAQPLYGVGHSMGATALLELGRLHPRLLAGVILLDPMVGPGVRGPGVALLGASARRRDRWAGRREAEEWMGWEKWVGRLERRVRERWLEFGFREEGASVFPELGQRVVSLRTPRAVEAWNYSRAWFEKGEGEGVEERLRAKYPDGQQGEGPALPFYRSETLLVWDDLPKVRPSVLYLFPDKGVSTPAGMDEKVARTGTGPGGSGGAKMGRCGKVVMPNAGHLVPFEKPDECASIIADWLASDLKSWQRREMIAREYRDDKSVDGVALSDEWIKQAKSCFQKHFGNPRAKL